MAGCRLEVDLISDCECDMAINMTGGDTINVTSLTSS